MKMWCLVSLPNSVVLEVELDAKALGQDCLNKVCQQLGIVETDFFGLLQIPSSMHDVNHNSNNNNHNTNAHTACGYWLNLRNLLNRQLTGSQPYRLQLKIKFYVKPHFILQPTTRNLFLQSLKHLVKEGGLECSDEELLAFLGFVAQAEHGDFKKAMLPALKEHYSEYLPESPLVTEKTFVKLAKEHKKHRGINKEKAVYMAIQDASEWSGYGMEWHAVRPLHSAVPMNIGVGPQSIEIINQQTNEIKSIVYEAIQKATHAGKSFYLHSMCDDGTINTETFKLPNQKASNGLYRCVTEMYLFYYCDTVRNDVASQFDRDIKGTLASLFSENKELGKKYVFDIQRTLQEAYDHNRRKLYTQEFLTQNSSSSTVTQEDENEAGEERGASPVNIPYDIRGVVEGFGSDSDSPSISSDEDEDDVDSCLDLGDKDCNNCKSEHKEMLADWLLCKVCCDADINTVFCPCGHVTCCRDCAEKLSTCPMCRQEVTNLQSIFLPSLLTPKDSTVTSTSETCSVKLTPVMST